MTPLPVRVCKRNRFAPLPEGAVWVGRPSRFANPFLITPPGQAPAIWLGPREQLPFDRPIDHDTAVAMFAAWLEGRHDDPCLAGVPLDRLEPRRRRLLAELPGLAVARALACACRPDQSCHADMLVRRLAALGAEPPEWR